LSKNRKSLNDKDIQIAQKGAYKPAYKKFQKSPGDQLQDMSQNMPVELAEIVAIWHDLPAHIKAAIKALIHICNKGVE